MISKVGALYVQRFQDPPTMAAVDQLETLTSGLSRKIWQKIMILDRVVAGGRPLGDDLAPVAPGAGGV
ncbi:MAG TPA: hypothetical protein VN811_17460 [Thermoanaerobaculia bacterium]|nr:hypothetical protein [Thermoanaerobaculia bacterium]